MSMPLPAAAAHAILASLRLRYGARGFVTRELSAAPNLGYAWLSLGALRACSVSAKHPARCYHSHCSCYSMRVPSCTSPWMIATRGGGKRLGVRQPAAQWQGLVEVPHGKRRLGA